MLRFQLRSLVVLALLFFSCGFFTSFLIFEGNKVTSGISRQTTSVKELTKEGVKNDLSFQKQLETMKKRNSALQTQIQLSEGLLDKAKQQANEKERQIKNLIETRADHPAKSSFQESFARSPTTYLSAQQRKLLEITETPVLPSNQQPCDSLAKEVLTYMEVNRTKDSIYEIQLLQFDSLLLGKESVIATSYKAYNDLKSLFDKTLVNQTTLKKENGRLASESKRQRFKSKLLAGGLLIISGFVTHLFLH